MGGNVQSIMRFPASARETLAGVVNTGQVAAANRQGLARRSAPQALLRRDVAAWEAKQNRAQVCVD